MIILIKRFRLAITLCLMIPIIIGYYSCVRSDIQPVIDDAVYRSAQLDGSKLEEGIKTYGLKTIFNLRGKNEGAEWYVTEKKIAESHGVSLHNFAFDSSSLPDVIPLLTLVDLLETIRSPLLVHCHYGVDRTSFISALILGLRDDIPYAIAKKQISWKFGIFPGRKSVGPLFFDQYESWLRDAGRKHSPNILRSWIRHHYVDNNGSIEYGIDTVQGKRLTFNSPGNGRSIKLESGVFPLTISGWAYDLRHKETITHMSVGLNGTSIAKAVFSYSRPDVVRYLNLLGNDDGDQNAHLGWSARFDEMTFDPGSYVITLHFNTPSGKAVTVTTDCVITMTR